MQNTYQLTPRALADLHQVASYSVQQWGITQRNKYLKALENKLLLLSQNPKLGKLRTDLSITCRSYPHEEHVIFYQELKQHIAIIGILHKRMDADLTP